MDRSLRPCAVAVLILLGAWTSVRAEILVVPLGEYAVSGACRDCHQSRSSGWRTPLAGPPAHDPGTATDVGGRSALPRRWGNAAGTPSPDRHVQRFGAPDRSSLSMGTVASHVQEEPNLLCASCHARGAESGSTDKHRTGVQGPAARGLIPRG